MPINLKDILCCPKCKGKLTSTKEQYVCKKCKLAYPIKNDIPVMLISEATPIEE